MRSHGAAVKPNLSNTLHYFRTGCDSFAPGSIIMCGASYV